MKQVEDLYDKKSKSLKKEIKEGTKSNLQIQCNVHQTPSKILHRPRKNGTQLHMENQKTQHTQNNPVQ